MYDFRAGRAPAEVGLDVVAFQHPGEPGQVLLGFLLGALDGQLAVDVHLSGQNHENGQPDLGRGVGPLYHLDGAEAAGTSVNGQQDVFHGRTLLWQDVCEEQKGERLAPFP